MEEVIYIKKYKAIVKQYEVEFMEAQAKKKDAQTDKVITSEGALAEKAFEKIEEKIEETEQATA